MPREESDSQVNVNCVLAGADRLVWSSKLIFFWPCGLDERAAAALAIAADIMPLSLPGSVARQHTRISSRELNDITKVFLGKGTIVTPAGRPCVW